MFAFFPRIPYEKQVIARRDDMPGRIAASLNAPYSGGIISEIIVYEFSNKFCFMLLHQKLETL